MRELSKKEQNVVAGGTTYAEVYAEVEKTANEDYKTLIDSGIPSIITNPVYYFNFGVYLALGTALYGVWTVGSAIGDIYDSAAAVLWSPFTKK